jgi:type IV pilus assembly protein PilW
MNSIFYKSSRLGQAGFSLIETLVAVAIGLILIGGVYQVFLTSDTGYRYNEQNSRLQENSRFLVDYIAREARMAGYYGCSGIEFYSSLLNTSSSDYAEFTYDFGEAVYGLEASGTTWVDDSGTVDPTLAVDAAGLGITNPISGSDILVLRGVDPHTEINVTSQQSSMSAPLSVPSGLDSSGVLDGAGGEILMATDCEEATVFQSNGYDDSTGALTHSLGSSVSGVPGNTTDSFGHIYGSDSLVFFPRTVIFYTRLNSDGEPSLYIKSGNSSVQELIAGVENMQVLYGQDTDNDKNVDSFVTANNVSDWEDVLAIRVGLLLRSPNEIAKKGFDTATYNVNGVDVDPIGNGTSVTPADDRRLRQVVVTTAGLRNRLP